MPVSKPRASRSRTPTPAALLQQQSQQQTDVSDLLGDTPPPIVSLKTKKDKKSEKIPIFEIDGKEYCVPRKPALGIAMKYLSTRKHHGELVAVAELLESLLGSEGYEALMSYPDLEDENLAQVVERASHLVLGRTKAVIPPN